MLPGRDRLESARERRQAGGSTEHQVGWLDNREAMVLQLMTAV